MTDRPRSAPMPAALRLGRPPRHAALAVRCPHCSAAPDMRCTTRAGKARTVRLSPCDARITAHVIATAVCSTCQVPTGSPCRDSDGYALDDLHTARIKEAGAAA